MSDTDKLSQPAAEWVPVTDLAPWDQNPRRNDEAAREVAKSIQRFGFGAPILARRSDGVVIAGHTRLKAAALLGLDKVPVRYLDLDPAEARALALADNRLGELADWDEAMLGDVLRDLEAEGVSLDGLGFTDDELKALLADPVVEPSENDDDAPEVDEHGEPDSVLGGVYELGPHRLVCGDSTTAEAWDALGIEAGSMVMTSPPYGVGGMHHLRNHLEAGVRTPKTTFYIGHDDSSAKWPALMRAWTAEALARVDCCIVNVQMLAENKRSLIAWMNDYAEHLIDVVMWDKGRGPPCAAANVLTTQFEFVIGLGPAGASRAWSLADFRGDRGNIMRVSPISDDDGSGHGARFPVEFARAVFDLVGDKCRVVVDPFGGSGTTMIAAAATGRIARLIELDPRYADVIRRRWTRWAREHGRDPGPGALDG